MNVTFIGMSGAGKSFVGKRFAERYGMQFIDIDVAMEQLHQKPLQTILEDLGDVRFLEEQSRQVINLGELHDTVISPGGSIVYTPEAIMFLKAQSVLVHLTVPLDVIQKRVVLHGRGIVGLGAKTFDQLYTERAVLYSAAADCTIDPTNHDVDDLLESIYEACMLK